MAKSVTTGSACELWQGLVREAEERAAVRVDEEQESYLVFTLLRHSQDQVLIARTLALELLDGLTLGGDRGSERLRDVGDRCLLLAGLFPGQSRRRSVDDGYFLELGRCAYGELGARRRDAMAELYLRLAQAFTPLVRVLRHLRPVAGPVEIERPGRPVALAPVAAPCYPTSVSALPPALVH